MTKKVYWLIGFLLLVLLVACGGKDEETPTPATEAQVSAERPTAEAAAEIEPAVVKFAVFDFERGRYDELIEAFEEENPDVQISLVSIEEILELDSLMQEWPDDASRRLVSAADASTAFYSRSAVDEDLLLDLTPLMGADRNFDPADFQPQVLAAFQSDGATWALPTEINYQLILFNKDLFDEAGVEYPQIGWSWSDFLTTAQAMTAREGDDVSHWGFVEVAPDPFSFLESRLGTLFDFSSDPPTPQLDDPAVAEMMQWYADLYLTHEVAPYFPQPDEDEAVLVPEGYSVIETGQAAMWPEYSGNWIYRSQQMNVGAVPFPVDSPDSASTRLAPSNLAISVGTANPEATWRWIEFLSRQVGETALTLGGNPATLPARRSVAEAAGFWDQVDPELGDALAFAVDHAYNSQVPSGAYDSLGDAFAAIVEDGKPVEDALAEAQAAAEDAIAEAGTAGETGESIVVEPGESDAEASADAVTIDFVALMAALSMQSFRDLARQFQAENPEIIVDVKPPDVLSGTPTIKDVAASADCFQWTTANFTDPATQAAILSLDPFLDADGTIDESEFYPMVMEGFQAQGQTWGLPGEVNISLIEYNKDLFDAAGIDYPTVDWTTDEFLDLALALTEGEGDTKQYGYVPDLFEPSDMLNLLDRIGVDLLDETADPPALKFDDPETIAAIRWYTALTTEHGVKPVLLTDIMGAAVTAVQERQALLDQGRAAMWVTSAFNIDLGGDTSRSYQTGAVPLPAGTSGDQGVGFQSALGYFISADTEAREACWQWIKFLTEQTVVGQGLPARQTVAESDAYRQSTDPALVEANLASIEGATKAPISQQLANENGWMGNAVIWLYQAYDQILKGEVGVEEALANVQRLSDEYRACVITADAFDDEKAQSACMLEIDDTLPPILFATE